MTHLRTFDPAESVRGWHLTIELSEHDAECLAEGYVPGHVKAQLRELLRWAVEDEERAARPVRT